MATNEKDSKSSKSTKSTKEKDVLAKITDKVGDGDEIKKSLKKLSDQVVDEINELKKKFDKSDRATKEKIVTGLSVAAAGLVVLAGIKGHKNKKDKK